MATNFHSSALQRRKVLELSDLLMVSLGEHVPSLNIKDTCLALSSVADVVKNRLAFSADGNPADIEAGDARARALLYALRRRLEDHLSQAPFRFSGRLLGLALNALAKMRDFGEMDVDEETRLFDLAERLILLKADEPDAFDLVSMSHIAHAYTALLSKPAPPPGVDPHLELPEIMQDFDSDFAERGAFGQFGSAAESVWASGPGDYDGGDGIASASDGLDLLRELEEWATSKKAEDGQGDGEGLGEPSGLEASSVSEVGMDEDEMGLQGGRQGSGRNSVPLSSFGPQGYGLDAVRDAGERLGSRDGREGGGDGNWREFGRYGRIVELVGTRMMELDASGLQVCTLARVHQHRVALGYSDQGL
jgi:hypothetical protein